MSLLPSSGEGRDYATRYGWTLGFAAVAFLVLIGRLYLVQVVKGDYYSERSRSNFVKSLEIPADRGMILDRRGTILADARPSYDVQLTPAFCGDTDATLEQLAPVLGLDRRALERVKKKARSATRLDRFLPIRVARDIDPAALDWVQARELELDGIDVRVRPQRNYRYGTMLAHVLGHMNEIGPQELAAAKQRGDDYALGDAIGRAGLEERFEEWLRGEDGLEQVVVDAKGRRTENRIQVGEGGEEESLIPEDERMKPSVPGHNVVLSIDARLQQEAADVFPGLEGAVVAVDPQTGYVLVLYSRPAFDPNRMSGGITPQEMQALRDDPFEPVLHRAIQQHYSPGSTFKAFTALAALGSGAVEPEDKTTCRGGYRLGRRRWRCWKLSGHGSMDLHHAIQQSCDTYFYWVGDRMGIDPIAHWARAAGFGARTGIGLAHEIPGIMPDVAYHDRYSVDGYQRGFALNTAIGQGDVNVTPLQLAMGYAAIANGGTLFRPQLVRRIELADGSVVREFQPEVIGKLGAKPEHLAAVVKGLRAVVMEKGGTAYYRYPRRVKGFDIEIAGKTGTAQVVRMGKDPIPSKDLDYEHRDHAWFVGFAPVVDPEIVVAVINEHAGHGSSAAAPTAMAIIVKYFELKKKDAEERAVQRPPEPPRLPPTAPVPVVSPGPPPDERHAAPQPEPRIPPAHLDTG